MKKKYPTTPTPIASPKRQPQERAPGRQNVTTYYVRDPQGSVMAVYEHKRGESDNGTFTLAEQHLYGAGRLGMKKRDLALNVANASEPTPVTHYELTNHLGNVMAVISDKASTTAEPTVVSLSDYYPFGMTEPGRSYTRPGDDYRFGYTGHEKENDLAEGVYTTEYRLLDTRLGRWLSVDPLFTGYPDMSSYNYCGGNPVMFWDPDGEEIAFEHYVADHDNYRCGHWISGLDKKIKKRWEDFAKTKEGYEILSKFAKAGQSIGSVKFEKDGEYSKHKLVLGDYDEVSGAAGYNDPPRIGKNGIVTFAIKISTLHSEEEMDITIGHEFFLHLDTYYKKTIENCVTEEGRKQLDKEWDANPDGDNDHKKYINNPNSFPKFKNYKEQLKKLRSKGKEGAEKIEAEKKVDNAIKQHDEKYKKFKKKK